MKNRLAKIISDVLNPFLVSFIVIILLSFKSTSSIPAALKWFSISIAISVLPVFIIIVCLVYCKKLEGIFVNPRQQRYKIYLLTGGFAVVSCIVLSYLGAPELLVTTYIAGLVAIVVFMGINFLWKISLHTAFITASVTILIIVYGTVGALTAILLPPVAWSRMELKLHTPTQVAVGALLAAFIVIVVFQLYGIIGSSI